MLITFKVIETFFFRAFSHKRSPVIPEGCLVPPQPTTSKFELSVTIGNKFQPLTNVKKNCNFLCGGDSRYPFSDTVKLGKTLKNMDNVLAKIVKKFIFSKMKFSLPVY